MNYSIYDLLEMPNFLAVNMPPARAPTFDDADTERTSDELLSNQPSPKLDALSMYSGQEYMAAPQTHAYVLDDNQLDSCRTESQPEYWYQYNQDPYNVPLNSTLPTNHVNTSQAWYGDQPTYSMNWEMDISQHNLTQFHINAEPLSYSGPEANVKQTAQEPGSLHSSNRYNNDLFESAPYGYPRQYQNADPAPQYLYSQPAPVSYDTPTPTADDTLPIWPNPYPFQFDTQWVSPVVESTSHISPPPELALSMYPTGLVTGHGNSSTSFAATPIHRPSTPSLNNYPTPINVNNPPLYQNEHHDDIGANDPIVPSMVPAEPVSPSANHPFSANHPSPSGPITAPVSPPIPASSPHVTDSSPNAPIVSGNPPSPPAASQSLQEKPLQERPLVPMRSTAILERYFTMPQGRCRLCRSTRDFGMGGCALRHLVHTHLFQEVKDTSVYEHHFRNGGWRGLIVTKQQFDYVRAFVEQVKCHECKLWETSLVYNKGSMEQHLRTHTDLTDTQKAAERVRLMKLAPPREEWYNFHDRVVFEYPWLPE